MWAGRLAKAMRITQSLPLLIPTAPCKLLGEKAGGHGGRTRSWMLAHLGHGQSARGVGQEGTGPVIW